MKNSTRSVHTVFRPLALAAALLMTQAVNAAVQGAATKSAAEQKRYTVPTLVKAMSPAVVFIGNVDKNGKVTSIGSGFVVDPSGVIVTNYHVIEGAHDAQIKMQDGEIYDRVEVVDYDARRDIAVLKVRAFKPLPALTLGDSSRLEVGEDAVAIGNPQGLEHTVTVGVVSAFRQAEGYRLIQISVPISPGSSGGPLFTIAGDVVGITTLTVAGGSAQNLNFAVPIEYVRPLLTSKTTMTLKQLTEKMSASPVGRRASQESSDVEIKAAWRVAHDHEGSSFGKFCLGTLYMTADQIGYANDSRIHNWQVPLTAVAEAAKNAVYGLEVSAFHIRLITKTNYNFAAINDQLQYIQPDVVLIAFAQAVQRLKQ